MQSANRSTGKLTLKLGAVCAPVSLYPSVRPMGSPFHLLHGACGQRLQQVMCCPKHGVLSRDRTTKGVVLPDGHTVPLTAEEVKALKPHTTTVLNLTKFLREETLTSAGLLFQESLYMAPDGTNDTIQAATYQYTTIATALQVMGMVAVGWYASRGRETPVVVRASPNGLMLHRLYFWDDMVVPPKIAKHTVSVHDLANAIACIEKHGTSNFSITMLKNPMALRLKRLLQRKVETTTTHRGMRSSAPKRPTIRKRRLSTQRSRKVVASR